jgi:hypothetical protein
MPDEQPQQPDPSSWEKMPPDLLKQERAEFNEAEYLAELREMEKTGGLRLEDFIEELEQRVRRGE